MQYEFIKQYYEMQDCKVLAIVECGSRAWRYHRDNSDHDLLVIYKYNLPEYGLFKKEVVKPHYVAHSYELSQFLQQAFSYKLNTVLYMHAMREKANLYYCTKKMLGLAQRYTKYFMLERKTTLPILLPQLFGMLHGFAKEYNEAQTVKTYLRVMHALVLYCNALIMLKCEYDFRFDERFDHNVNLASINDKDLLESAKLVQIAQKVALDSLKLGHFSDVKISLNGIIESLKQVQYETKNSKEVKITSKLVDLYREVD